MKHQLSQHSQQRVLLISHCLVFIVGVLSLLFSYQLYAQQQVTLFLPISSADQSEFTQELKAALDQQGLRNTTLQFADHWHDYQQGLREGKAGIYFAAPHFSAWAINRHEFKPLVKIAAPLSYVISAKYSNTKIFEITDLIRQQVCSTQPLELDYIFLTETFENQFASFDHQFVPAVYDEMNTKESDCDGFVISDHFLQRMIKNGNREYTRLHQSETYNNYSFIAHPYIDTVFLEKLTAFLIDKDNQALLQPILERYANDSKLIQATTLDYPIEYLDSLKSYWPPE